ncbi:MAG: sulfur reduction protein DsrS [Gammaproteobacteria bacterium]|jgi:hypothetical protein
MELSREDALRLNVLLAGEVHAIRIDESAMTVYGLSERGEAQIKLNPCGRSDHYLRLVRETISGQVLGSPGGYPVYLKRWTRMGQARDESLAQLLKLGEPEAVSAVVHARGLTEALARHAWWAMPSAENARSMLLRTAVLNSSLGPVLAEYLVDYLPFETEPSTTVETVRLVLQQPLLISPEVRQGIWNKAKHKTTYQVGFLLACPDDLPELRAPRPGVKASAARLEPLLAASNPFAQQLVRVWSASGQSFVSTVEQVLRKPADQDIVLLLFKAIAGYFQSVRMGDEPEADMETLMMQAARWCAQDSDISTEQQAALRELIQCCPECKPDIEGMLVLACLGYPAVRPVFSRTTAIGSLMRKKLESVTCHLFAYLRQLQGQGES